MSDIEYTEESAKNIINYIIDSDISTRKGVQADAVIAKTAGTISMLDFIQTESIDGSEGHGVLVARIFMTNNDLLKLKTMLDEHTKAWQDEKTVSDGN